MSIITPSLPRAVMMCQRVNYHRYVRGKRGEMHLSESEQTFFYPKENL